MTRVKLEMKTTTLRRRAYQLASLLAAAYVIYVLVLKFSHQIITGPLGELGEFGLVLASVTAFSIGLFADEIARNSDPH